MFIRTRSTRTPRKQKINCSKTNKQGQWGDYWGNIVINLMCRKMYSINYCAEVNETLMRRTRQNKLMRLQATLGDDLKKQLGNSGVTIAVGSPGKCLCWAPKSLRTIFYPPASRAPLALRVLGPGDRQSGRWSALNSAFFWTIQMNMSLICAFINSPQRHRSKTINSAIDVLRVVQIMTYGPRDICSSS
jgi:hypothetical protein